MALRSFSRRDSATKLLKKLGIDKSRYNDFIVRHGSQDYRVDETAAIESLKPQTKAVKTVAKPAPAAKPAKAAKAAKALKPGKVTVVTAIEAPKKVSQAQQIRDLILKGKGNDEIVELLNLPLKKLTYPAWYRSQLKKQGRLGV